MDLRLMTFVATHDEEIEEYIIASWLWWSSAMGSKVEEDVRDIRHAMWNKLRHLGVKNPIKALNKLFPSSKSLQELIWDI